MKKVIVTTILIASAALTSTGAEAQMCGAGSGAPAAMCGMMGGQTHAQSGQSAMPGMSGMMHDQSQGTQAPQGQGMMQGGMMGCPMMKQMAALQERVRQLEDMAKPGAPKQ